MITNKIYIICKVIVECLRSNKDIESFEILRVTKKDKKLIKVGVFNIVYIRDTSIRKMNIWLNKWAAHSSSTFYTLIC